MKNLAIFLALLMSVPSFADEFFSYGGGGLSTSRGFGGLFGVGYVYFFTPNWGIESGLEKAFYNSTRELEGIRQEQHTETDSDGNEIEIRSTMKGCKEEQSFQLLQIPFMLQYQREIGENHEFYAMAGTKIGIPITGKTKIIADSLVRSGYRPYEDYEYTTQEFMGFGKFQDKTVKTEKLSLQTAVLLSAETGMKWKLNEALRLYSGIYFDYGIEAKPLALGLKLKLAYSFRESKILK